MNESILTSIKKLLGIPEQYEQFDQDIVIHINSVFFILNQLGVGPEEGFSIADKTAVWSDFLGDAKNLESVKSYVYLKTRLLFDPPTSSAAIESLNRLTGEMEWRINEQIKDAGLSGGGGSDDHELYIGPYSVTPRVYPSELQTKDKLMADDLTVEQIPISVVENQSSGKTATIG